MGAQDRGTWIELPFWRQLKYYLICMLIGIIIGWISFAIGAYTDWLQQLSMYVVNFHVAYPIILVVYAGFLSIIALDYRLRHKKKPMEVKNKK